MSSESHFRSALDRVLAISWKKDYSRVASACRLMQEYLRRMNLWTEVLGDWRKWPRIDVAAVIDPSAELSDDTVEQLEALFEECRLNKEEMLPICLCYLRRAMAEHHGRETRYDLPEPYEPMIRMFERGQLLTTEHGWWMASEEGGIMYKALKGSKTSGALLDLSDEKLDEFDA